MLDMLNIIWAFMKVNTYLSSGLIVKELYSHNLLYMSNYNPECYKDLKHSDIYTL